MSTIQCMSCDYVSVCFDPILDLSLPIPEEKQQLQSSRSRHRQGSNTCDIYDCLRAFTEVEYLAGDEAYHCPQCNKKRKAQKQLLLNRPPEILVLHLKRFSFHVYLREKVVTFVKYPLQGLDLQPFVANFARGYLEPKYDLFATVNHIGSVSGGHYTAFCRSPEDEKWYLKNDSIVRGPIPESSVVTEDAYLLFYKRRS